MNDDELFELFKEGTALHRDPHFSEQLKLRLRHSQQMSALLKGVRFCCVTMLVVGLFALTQVYQATFGAIAIDVASPVSSVAMPLFVAAICSAVAVLRRRIH